MPKKIKIKEIKKNIKVTEIKQEEQKQESSDNPDIPLEEIASNAPSSRLFPRFQQPSSQEQELPPEIQPETESGQQAEQAGPRYAVRNITEGELRRQYESGESRANRETEVRRSSLLLHPTGAQRDDFRDRNLFGPPKSEEDEKYSQPMDMKPKKETRRYPWEA